MTSQGEDHVKQLSSPQQRRNLELAANLADVEARLTAAARAAGRDRSELTLIAVSKTWPVGDIAALHALGVADFGENRDQEARDKAAELPQVRWHFVGTLQSSKARSVGSYAAVVHSVDRPSLVRGLAQAAAEREGGLAVLLQVSLDGDTARGGVLPVDLPALAEATATAPGLQLAGVMAVAPRASDPVQAFTELARLAARLRLEHPQASWISAGMSGDLEAAIAAGATHVRVGSALFGHRTPVLR